MKSSIIYEKKKITIGEFVSNHKTYLYWFCFLLINLIINYYSNLYVKNKINLNLCEKDTICDYNLEFYSDKLNSSKKIIYVGFFINLFLMIMENKITPFFDIIFIHELRMRGFISTCAYFIPSLFYKSMLFYLVSHDNELRFNQYNESIFSDLTLMAIAVYYICTEGFAMMIFMILFVRFLEKFFDVLNKIINKLSKIVYNFYESNIKDITFEYTESKFVDIEKNI